MVGLPMEALEPRPTCYECFRPQSLCYCADVRRVRNKTRVVVLQHPREVFHPIGTARLVERCLEQVDVLRGSARKLDRELVKLNLPEDTALLYPSPDAIDLEDLVKTERPGAIVVLDGTWHHARTLRRDVGFLEHLRPVRFSPPAPSEYRIRKEPQADYLSTVESVVHVLSRLEPETQNVESLRTIFLSMIERNVRARRVGDGPPRHKRRSHVALPTLPEILLASAPEHVVVVYGEGAPHPNARGRKEPLIVLAERLAELAPERSGVPRRPRSFEALLRTSFPPHPTLLDVLGLEKRHLQAAESPEVFAGGFSDFLHPRDVVVAWNRSTLQILDALGGNVGRERQIFLKDAYCNYRRHQRPARGSWGGLSEILNREGIPAALPARGRADLRLAETAALTRFLRSGAQSSESPAPSG